MPDIARTVQHMRTFNRFYTHKIGVLNETLAGSDFTLAETRVLLELGFRDWSIAVDIARDLSLDPAYLARMLSKFDGLGFVSATPDPDDGRRRRLQLTKTGRETIDALQAMTERDLAGMLNATGKAERAELTQAMGRIERIIGDRASETLSAQSVSLRAHRPGDLGWVISRQANLYADEYGWSIEFEGLLADICATFIKDYQPGKEFCWIAEQGGERLGAIFLVRQDDATAKLRMLHVEKAARGKGVGSMLVTACADQARACGYQKLVLWTNDVLADARRLYQRAGFTLTSEDQHHSFGKDLVGQYWELEL